MLNLSEMSIEQVVEAIKHRNDPGTEPPCPFCNRPRVMRSDYVRCNPCGINWIMEELQKFGPSYLNRNPSAVRWEHAHMATTTKSTADQKAGDAE